MQAESSSSGTDVPLPEQNIKITNGGTLQWKKSKS